MIIQCEQCSTKFRLDDAKIKDKGVKVRCAKCRHVFTVTKQQDLESPDEIPAGFGLPSAPGPDEAPAHDAVAQSGALPSHPFAAGSPGDDVSFASPAIEPPPAPTGEVDFGFSFSDEAPGVSADHEEAPAPANEADFSDFDFGDVAAAKEQVSASPALDFSGDGRHSADPAPDAAGFDFGDGNLFGDAVAAPAPEEPAEPISFDFSAEAFADSLGASEEAPGGGGTVSGIAAAQTDEPFSLGEIDFGDELTSVAVQHVNPEELKPAQELLFAPLAEAQEKKGSDVGEGPDAAAFFTTQQEELPPLSISSRRKQSPVFMGVAAALVVAVVALLGYAGYSMFGGEKVAKESGRISVRGINAAFVKNSAAGELVVISGEAVNEFGGPRAAIQVKGMIYGPNGQVLASKSAFCGNPLTREQLAGMPLDKIEAAMANQFGDSLDNLEVQPGKAIPFVIVIAKPPADARDYGVQPAGSTVATGKQP
ncbi:DUF3426 domain-containing protein [Oryzomonas sagensis]|uniref:DUF3426 domain-containing protein n=1 Tax=Oryzomonas sagensis TaxID=2603857 RepID=A0ABQ6TQT7_9BACT|nr:DUF3426 domain-containing protein [Oryzomonas sagensis]KAB0671404.1 DUF3426 domain-containing protein [Oryzomonas sagensis]